MSTPNRREKWEVFFSGHVQGVGFRYSTLNVAKRFDVVGFVENDPDGRVHLVVEGAPSELQTLLDELAAAMAGYIRETKIDRRPATGEFEAFEIRH